MDELNRKRLQEAEGLERQAWEGTGDVAYCLRVAGMLRILVDANRRYGTEDGSRG